MADSLPEGIKKAASLVDPSVNAGNKESAEFAGFSELVKQVLEAFDVGGSNDAARDAIVEKLWSLLEVVTKRDMSGDELSEVYSIVTTNILRNSVCGCSNASLSAPSEDPASHVEVKDDTEGTTFARVLVRLKDIGQRVRSQLKDRSVSCSNKRLCESILFLFDTCYGDVRAVQLSRALRELEERLGADLPKFLVLLAAVYTKMIREPEYVLRAEWFPMLARAAAGAVGFGSRDSYLPVCPGKGDVAAILYYLYLKAGDTRVGVSADDVEKIVAKLANLPKPRAPEGTAESSRD